MNDIEDLLLNATGARVIAFNANFARICGCVKSGLFLSQAMYWQKRAGKREWFYKTQKDWELETMLTRSEQDLVRKKLRNLGLLKERLAGLPAKVHFQVDILQLADKLQQLPSLQESDKLDCGIPATVFAVKQQSGLPENSKLYKEEESTTESTQRKVERPAPRPSMEDVRTYCLERKNHVDPEKWFDYYSSNGWKVGRNSMKDWKAAVRTWERNGFSNGNGNHRAPSADPVEDMTVRSHREAIANYAKRGMHFILCNADLCEACANEKRKFPQIITPTQERQRDRIAAQ